MRRLASALFTLLVAATPAMAQPYGDQPYPYDVDVDVDVDVDLDLDLDAPIYTDVSVAPLGEEIPDVSVFYDRLSPYGSWVDDAEYGYVFTPADTSYVPYSNGHWKLTDFGWTWIAADQHGWATSHYGRWVWRNRWVWRPDTTWGPAWVQWRESDNVVGWAPLGYDVDAYVPESNWRFIPTVYITSTDVSRYYVRADVARYVRDTRPIVRWNRYNDRRWVAGPDRAYLERNKVRVQRAAYQPREIGRFDAAERRQLEQRAAEAKVKYRARVARDAQVRTKLETKRAVVERRQVEQHRERARQRAPRKQVEVQREVQQREQAKRQTEQRNERKQQVEAQQREQARRQTEQRDRKQQVEAQQRQTVEKQRADRREQEQRARQQVEERKLQDKQHEQRERRQLDERKQRQAQQREQQVEERKLRDKQHEQNERRQLDERRQAPQRQPQREQAEQRREQREQKQQQRNEQQKARADERRQPSPPDRERPKKDDRDDRKKK